MATNTNTKLAKKTTSTQRASFSKWINMTLGERRGW